MGSGAIHNQELQLFPSEPLPLAPSAGEGSIVDTGEDRIRNPSAFKRGAGIWANAFSSKLGWMKALAQLEWYYTWWSAEPDPAAAAYAQQHSMEFVPMVVRGSSSPQNAHPVSILCVSSWQQVSEVSARTHLMGSFSCAEVRAQPMSLGVWERY